MRKRLTLALLALLAMLGAPMAMADGPGSAGPDVAAPPVRAAPIAPPANSATQAPAGRSGVIPLNNGELTLNIPSSYRFYSAEEAYGYLQRNNAAAPSGTVLGLLAPASANIRAPGAWATVVSYDGIGYVQSETAGALSDASFEAAVRSARQAQNRVFEGFAADPAFDASASQLVWAERSAPPGAGGKDYRREQKFLGRYGVACLTSLGAADQVDEIAAAAGDLGAMLSFPEGRRYGDFQPANDEVSTFGVPGLVTGVPADAAAAEAAGAGSEGGQTAFGGLAGWFPWIALGVVGVAFAGYMLMRRRRDVDEDDDEDDDDEDEDTGKKEESQPKPET